MNFLAPNSSSHVQTGPLTSEVGIAEFLTVISIVFHLTQAVLYIAACFNTVWFFDTVYQRLRDLFAWRSHT